MKTHKVIDQTDNEFDGDTSGIFAGTFEECQEIISQGYGLIIEELTSLEKEIENKITL